MPINSISAVLLYSVVLTQPLDDQTSTNYDILQKESTHFIYQRKQGIATKNIWITHVLKPRASEVAPQTGLQTDRAIWQGIRCIYKNNR